MLDYERYKDSKTIGLKWIVQPIEIKGLPIFNTKVYYDNLMNTKIYSNDLDVNTIEWKKVYDVTSPIMEDELI